MASQNMKVVENALDYSNEFFISVGLIIQHKLDKIERPFRNTERLFLEPSVRC